MFFFFCSLKVIPDITHHTIMRLTQCSIFPYQPLKKTGLKGLKAVYGTGVLLKWDVIGVCSCNLSDNSHLFNWMILEVPPPLAQWSPRHGQTEQGPAFWRLSAEMTSWTTADLRAPIKESLGFVSSCSFMCCRDLYVATQLDPVSWWCFWNPFACQCHHHPSKMVGPLLYSGS